MGSAEIELPGFELLAELGRGTYSIVYRARHANGECAVKLSRRGGRPSQWFRREAAALARVEHPGIPAVLDVGEQDGRAYLVMELVRGETLRTRLLTGPLGLAETLRLGLRLVDIARALHARGLVHRDIKPANIIVTVGDKVRLVDFGFASRLHPRLGLADVAGTERYAAPEQLHSPQLVDGRADLHAIGRVLRECLGPPREVGAGASERAETDLRTVLARLTETHPADRYRSAAAVGEELQRIVDGEPLAGPTLAVSVGLEEQPRTVGRLTELAQFDRAWARANEGAGGLVLLEGAAGAGKSHFVAHATHRVFNHNAGAVRLVHTAHRGSPPFAAVSDLVDQFLDCTEDLSAELRAARHAAAAAAAAGPAAPLLASMFPSLAAVLGHPPRPLDRAHDALVEAAAAFVIGLAEPERPVLICLDDLQWLDPLSREVLVRVAVLARAAPLLILAAARSQQRELAPLKRFVHALDSSRSLALELPPLDDAAVAELIADNLLFAPEPGLTHWVSSLAGGTPLGVLEALGALIDAGALQPHWGAWRFDPGRAQLAPLPHGVEPNIARRLDLLPAATRRVLQTAAVVGLAFDPEIVARAVGIEVLDLGFALAEAARAGLVTMGAANDPRFVHQSVGEAALARLSAEARRHLHQRVAEALEPGASNSSIFELARHYTAGTLADPEAAARVGRTAAATAADSLDHERTLECLELVRRAAGRSHGSLGLEFFDREAEALIGVGNLRASLVALEQCLALAGPNEHARVFARIAWVHQARGDQRLARKLLDQAFVAAGEPVPSGGLRELPEAAVIMAVRRLRNPSVARLDPRTRARLELLCELHYQNARLGVEYNQPIHTVHSAVAILAVGNRLGPSPTMARAYGMYGMFMTVLGRRRAGRRYLEVARSMAGDVADPAALAQTAQFSLVASCFRGDFDEALEHAFRCLDTYGHWVETGELCLNVAAANLIESVRGRPREAMAWLERARSRVCRQGSVPAAYRRVVEPALEASLISLGRARDRASKAADSLGVGAEGERAQGMNRLLSWGPRAMALLESGDIAGLDRLTREFAGEGHNPRRVHPVVAEYYIAVAHARATQCLHASTDERARLLPQFELALADLRLAARLDPFKGHLEALEGIRSVLTDDLRRAQRHFERARALGVQQSAPWVSFTAARGMAHLRRAQGRDTEALGFAREAAAIAGDHGTVTRGALVRTEFGLGVSASESSSRASSQSRQLRALTHVLESTPEQPDAIARSILSELIAALVAERAALLFERTEGEPLRLLVGQTKDGSDWDPAANAELLGRLFELGDLVLLEVEGLVVPANTIAVPLRIQTKRVGALLVCRPEQGPGFSSEEIGLCMSLVAQASVALELARVLAERDRLQDKLRHAHRMEAAGQLASGIAHDFNNMLTAIFASLDRIDDPHDPSTSVEHLGVIRDCAGRASALTQQLLAFSRRQMLEMDVVDASDVVGTLLPLVQHMVGPGTTVSVRDHNEACPVYTDRASLENAIINLVANARDAMPDGGTLELRVGPGTVKVRAGETAYNRIEVHDTGTGMTAEVQKRLFEPFFTTKALGSGTGLGLASVYGFVNQCGGHIDVVSTLGHGSTFTIHLPVTGPRTQRPSSTTLKAVPSAVGVRPGTQVLLVDDEETIRTVFRARLERAGFRVFTAGDGREALALVRGGLSPDLVVTDIQMPHVSGPELVERLAQMGCQARVLFMSGFAGREWMERDAVGHAAEVLHKPFRYRDLERRMIEVLARPPDVEGNSG